MALLTLHPPPPPSPPPLTRPSTRLKSQKSLPALVFGGLFRRGHAVSDDEQTGLDGTFSECRHINKRDNADRHDTSTHHNPYLGHHITTARYEDGFEFIAPGDNSHYTDQHHQPKRRASLAGFKRRVKAMDSQPGLPKDGVRDETTLSSSSTASPLRSKPHRLMGMLHHPLKAMAHHDDEFSTSLKSNSDVDTSVSSTRQSSRTRTQDGNEAQRPKAKIGLKKEEEEDSSIRASSRSASSSRLGKLFKSSTPLQHNSPDKHHHFPHHHPHMKPSRRDKTSKDAEQVPGIPEIHPVLSSSAPSSRSPSQLDMSSLRKDTNLGSTPPSPVAPPASAAPTMSDTNKHFFRFRSKSMRDDGPDGTLKGGSLSPAKFLPAELMQSNWSLGAKYSSSKQSMLKTRYIGRGATAVVKTIHANKTKEVFACKVFHRKSPIADQSQEDYYKRLSEEYEVARLLSSHRNVVSTRDLCLDSNDSWCCVMEFCDMGDIFSLIEAYKVENKRMAKSERNCLFKQLVMGLNYMHKNGVAHRDIKPENLLLNSKGELKITDFGVSDIIRDPQGNVKHATGLCGSTPYIAPEVFECKGRENNSEEEYGYDARKVDVWAAAIVMANLAFNGGLFPKADPEDAAYARFCQEHEKYWAMEEGLQRYLEEEEKKQGNEPGSMLNTETTTTTTTTQTSSQATTPQAKSPEPTHGDGNSPPNTETVTRDEYIFMNSEGSLDQPLFFFNDFGETGKRVMAKMLTHDPAKRPLICDLVNTGFIKKIGMCIGPDVAEESDIQNIDVTNMASVRKMKLDQVYKNHTHKPPSKPQKQLMIGSLRDPYAK